MKIFWIFISLLSVLSSLILLDSSIAWAGQSSSVGYIKTPAGMSSAECYTLLRNEKAITDQLSSIYVFNDDVIIPQKGKSIRLIYKNTSCGEKILTKRTVVRCIPTDDKPGWMLNLFSEVIKRAGIGREPLGEKDATVNRNDNEIVKIKPFPYNFFVGQAWPVKGSTILYGEPVFFRWKGGFSDKAIHSSTKVKLVITKAEKKTGRPLEKDMEIGEFIRISADKFNEGELYEWYVMADDSTSSDHYPFKILKKEVSDNIQSQLKEVSLKYADRSPELMQALYLQILSDTKPELDLYADSFRIVMEYSEIPALNKVLEGIFFHKMRN